MHLYQTTFSNKYHWARVRVVANNEAQARAYFEAAVDGWEWRSLADEERSMWIEEVGEFDHDAYSYGLDDDQEIEMVEDAAPSDKLGVVVFLDAGCNG